MTVHDTFTEIVVGGPSITFTIEPITTFKTPDTTYHHQPSSMVVSPVTVVLTNSYGSVTTIIEDKTVSLNGTATVITSIAPATSTDAEVDDDKALSRPSIIGGIVVGGIGGAVVFALLMFLIWRRCRLIRSARKLPRELAYPMPPSTPTHRSSEPRLSSIAEGSESEGVPTMREGASRSVIIVDNELSSAIHDDEDPSAKDKPLLPGGPSRLSLGGALSASVQRGRHVCDDSSDESILDVLFAENPRPESWVCRDCAAAIEAAEKEEGKGT